MCLISRAINFKYVSSYLDQLEGQGPKLAIFSQVRLTYRDSLSVYEEVKGLT